MPSKFVEQAKAQMGAVEEMLTGLPGIKGYLEKELRRDADYRLRTMLAGQLEEQKQRLFAIQQRLLKGGGLKWLDEVDSVIRKLQTLIDRVRTAPQGYAGLFDAVRIREEQLDALHKFDVALAEHIAGVKGAIDELTAAVDSNGTVGDVIEGLTDIVTDVNAIFARRDEAIVQPDLLTEE